MKKLFILVLGSLALFSAPAFSQVVFADLEADTKKETLSDSARIASKGVFDNAVYFKAGKSIPVGKFGQAPSMAQTGFDSFNGIDGSGAQNGWTIEAGLLYYIHQIRLPRQFRFGIDAGVAASVYNLDWSKMDERFTTTPPWRFFFFQKLDRYIFAGVKVGPAISYNITDKLIADVFFKLNPCISNGINIDYKDWRNMDEYYYYLLHTRDHKTFSLRKSLGLNVRYSALMLGVEYNYGKVGYILTESYTTKSANSLDSNNTQQAVETGEKTLKVNMPTSMLHLTLGLKF